MHGPSSHLWIHSAVRISIVVPLFPNGSILIQRVATHEKRERSQAFFFGRYRLVGLLVNAFGVGSDHPEDHPAFPSTGWVGACRRDRLGRGWSQEIVLGLLTIPLHTGPCSYRRSSRFENRIIGKPGCGRNRKCSKSWRSVHTAGRAARRDKNR